ncbi:MAG: S8 family serine peptidase [Deltaproteobacteria bacterium]|nr:S8 family serine peptidase [Deltaproteobacteria bacterium]
MQLATDLCSFAPTAVPRALPKGLLGVPEPFDPLFDGDPPEPLPRYAGTAAPMQQRAYRRDVLKPRKKRKVVPLAFAFVGMAMACGNPKAEVRTIDDVVLVQLKTAAQLPSFAAQGPLARAVEPVAELSSDESPPLWRVPLPKGADVDAAARALALDPAVARAEPVFVYPRLKTPNDTDFSQQWGLAKINAPKAWDRTTGDRKTVVAIVDDGIDLQHTDLTPNLWTNPDESDNGKDNDGDGIAGDLHGANFVDGVAEGDPQSATTGSERWHGSHVAGIIGAASNNGKGVAGVNWQVQLMAVRAIGTQGGRSDDLARAIDYASSHGARVINASWGGGGTSATIVDAIARAEKRGALFIAAAGNDGDSAPGFPANVKGDGVISVGATTQTDALADFSNAGALVAAPGVGILSTTSPGRYESYDGTSMATPFVSGLAALLWSAHPEATAANVKEAIVQSAKKVSGVSAGRIDAAAALTALDGLVKSPTDAALTVSRDAVELTSTPDGSARAQVVSVRAEGGLGVPVQAKASAAWLHLPRPSGTTPMRLTIDADAAGLAVGDHAGTVTITPAGGGKALKVSVTLHVTQKARIVASGAACAFEGDTLHVTVGTVCVLDASALPPGDSEWLLDGIHLATGPKLVGVFSHLGPVALSFGGRAVDVTVDPSR